jgi:hypothetical protein
MAPVRATILCAAILALAPAARADGLTSTGNTDGVLTWRLGKIEPGQSAREVVLFASADSPDAATKLLEVARREFATATAPPDRKNAEAQATVWIKNAATDFALSGPGHFFWEGARQSLSCPAGGQLSRFGWYVHYSDGADRRAGTPISDRTAENLRVTEPLAAVAADQAVATLETADGQLRIRLRAKMGSGAVAALEFVLTNPGAKALTDVHLSAYANLEAAHTHENDYSALDAHTGALLTVDPPTNACVLMAGLGKPASGYAGRWPSGEQLRTAAGSPVAKWTAFAGIPAETKNALVKNPQAAGIFEEYAPAPPVAPSEPETRSLTETEAAAVLERDWLFQAEGKPPAARAAEEIGWARQLAARLAQNPRTPDLAADLADLTDLEKRLADKLDDDAARKVYLAVRAAKRRITLKNPAVDFSQVLFIDNPFPAGREWPHQARHRNGMMAVPGGRLLVLDGLSPAGRLHKLAPEKPGSFWRPDLSFDGKKVLFCYWPHDEKSFHLYEINVDGTGLRQLTAGPYDDTDPIYLPDGHILFTTTRSNTYVRCMPYTYSYVLARCDADGGNVYLVSYNSEPDWCPSLLNDGRVIYSRWEYTDKALWRIQSLWTTNQDGTGTAVFWGNQSVWPDHLAEPRPIPGSGRIMFTGVAHHNWFAGSIGIIDPAKGFNFPAGLTKVTAETPWPECGQPPLDPHEAPDYHTAGRFQAYKTPYPISEEDFLVSTQPAGKGGKFLLYLMDVRGNRELIYEGAHNIWHAMPLKARERPPAQPDRVAWPGTGKDRKTLEGGTFFSANVYQGVPDLPQGKAKFLRVIQMDARTYSMWTRDGRFSGPIISALQDDGVKRILGTTPIEADGSVHFKAPPGVALHFQLLDEHGRALQTMRSFTGLMPGENRGCVGCHESHSVSSAPGEAVAAAIARKPADLVPPPWGTASISYERLVQPVLDQYCIRCHAGDAKDRAKPDLTLRPGSGAFKEPYLALVGPVGFGLNEKNTPPGIAGALMCENYGQNNPESYITARPMKHLSYASRLIDLAMSGKHYDVKVDSVGLQKLIAWVDANCPYRGDEDVRAIPDPAFPGVEKLPIPPLVKSAPVIVRP